MTAAINTRVPWTERWTQPTVEDLLNDLKPHQQRNFGRMIEFLDGLDELDHELIWHGDSWQWTIHYFFKNRKGGEGGSMAYFVPNLETPVANIPLSDELILTLPWRRMTRFIRDGIRSSKCAVKYHWASWTPGLENETGMLIDLLKRKYKHVVGETKTKSTSKKTKKTTKK